MDADELRYAVHELPALPHKAFSHLWLLYRHEMRMHMLYDDMSDFTNFSTSRAVIFVGDNTFSRQEADVLFKGADKERWIEATQEVELGHPERMANYPFTSGNMVHQAFHHYQWEKATGKSVKDLDCIIEFGGGYGAQCVLCRNLGFKGTYIIYDLPEFSLLQQYYLSQRGVDFTLAIVEDDYRFEYPRKKADLMIALYSISEVSKGLRDAFMQIIDPHGYFICHQESYLGNENLTEEFDDIMRAFKQYQWQTVAQPYVPGHRYVFGEKING